MCAYVCIYIYVCAHPCVYVCTVYNFIKIEIHIAAAHMKHFQKICSGLLCVLRYIYRSKITEHSKFTKNTIKFDPINK